jgi:hypothetical protein
MAEVEAGAATILVLLRHASDGWLSMCRVLSPSLLTCLDHFVQIPHWPDLELVAVR